jgi:uncharacterized protein (DUF4415 family)
MKTKMVRYTLETLPELTSDIPVMTDEQWKKSARRDLYRPVKLQVTARLDADVLAWLKAQGKGYQSRINAILRREMLAARHGAAE